MNGPQSHRLIPEDLTLLRGRLLAMPEVFAFADEPELAAWVASVGLQREFGTINDELARFVFDPLTGTAIPAAKLRAELVRYGEAVGVRLWSKEHDRLEIRLVGLRALLDPRFSFREDGTLYQCVFFPASLAKIAALEDTELVIVRDWALNTIFGNFDPAKSYYQTNFWELENNDALRFARLLEARKLPLLGTHDLVAHIAGARAEAWPDLSARATKVRETLERYFGTLRAPTIASLVLPYLIGVLLDDLAQPPNYGAIGRRVVIDQALEAVASGRIDPRRPFALTRFPESYEKAVQIARDSNLDALALRAKTAVDAIVAEIHSHSIVFRAS